MCLLGDLKVLDLVYLFLLDSTSWGGVVQEFLLLLFSHSAMSDSLWPHGPQHVGLPCPSPSPGACSYSSTESMMPSNHLILCHPLLLLSSIFASIRVFSNESFSRTLPWDQFKCHIKELAKGGNQNGNQKLNSHKFWMILHMTEAATSPWLYILGPFSSLDS